MSRTSIIIPVAIAGFIAAAVTPDKPSVQRNTTTVVTKVVEKRVEVKVPVKRPDGYMDVDQCGRLGIGTPLSDVVWLYGWPAADNGTDSYTGLLKYPIREDHRDTCRIDMAFGKVNTINYKDN